MTDSTEHGYSPLDKLDLDAAVALYAGAETIIDQAWREIKSKAEA
jgi:hypothetical protein